MRRTYGPEEEALAAVEAARAIDFIEQHLFEKLTVSNIARACSASPFHFSRRFGRRQGETVMSYVRGRRLDIAAMRLLREPELSLVDLAFEVGFDSQSAFTRAFTRAFGKSPHKYRSLQQPIRRRRRFTMSNPELEVSVVFIKTFRVAGLSGRFDPSNFIRLNELWKAFAAKASFIGRVGDGETCGVFRERDPASQSFEHLAGARLDSESTPEGLEVWTLPARRYLKFKQTLTTGELYPQVAAAQAEIWGKRLPASGHKVPAAPDFQIYPANFSVSPSGSIEYYIPIE